MDLTRKLARRLRGRLTSTVQKRLGIQRGRMVWTVRAISDADGPTDNVRAYLDRRTIRSILSNISREHRLESACEVGCGYGRIIMVLQEYAARVVGFEREQQLLDIASPLLPGIDFCRCDSLSELTKYEKGTFVMTCAVLQHLTDGFCRQVLGEIKRMAPQGYVLLTEKTIATSVTDNTEDGNRFISRARSVELYQEWMAPFVMVGATPRVVEPTYFNRQPGTCMLFKSPGLMEP